MGKRINSKKQVNKLHIKGNSQTYYKDSIIVGFKSQEQSFMQKQSNHPQDPMNTSIIPTFNHDHKEYTPAFILPFIKLHHEELYSKHYAKAANQNVQIDINQIMMPKPKGKDYCNPCRTHFEDYLSHCRSYEHSIILKKSHYQQRIHRLCKRFQDSSKPQARAAQNCESSEEEKSEETKKMSEHSKDSINVSCILICEGEINSPNLLNKEKFWIQSEQ